MPSPPLGTAQEMPALRRLGIPVIALVLGGVVAGRFLATSPLKESLLLSIGFLAILLPLLRPTYTLYALYFAMVMMTDSLPKGVTDAFAIQDFDVVKGLPSALQLYILLMIAITTARHVLFKMASPASLWYLAAWCGVLAFAFYVGTRNGWLPIDNRIGLRNMLLPVLVFYVSLSILDRKELALNMVQVLFAAAVIKACVLDVYFLLGRGVPFALDGVHVSRIVTNDSGDLMLFIGMALLVLVALASKQVRGLRWGFAVVSLAPLLFAVAFSFRRAHWLGLALSVVVALIWAGRELRGRMLKPLLLGLAAFLLLAPPLVAVLDDSGQHRERLYNRFHSLFDAEQSSNKYHYDEAMLVLGELRAAPLAGLGLGSRHAPLDRRNPDGVPTHVVHNTFLYMWMKTGLPGLLLFLWAGIALVKRCARFLRRTGISPERTVVLALGSMVGVVFAMAMTGPVPWYLRQTMLIALIAALVVRLTQGDPPAFKAEGHLAPGPRPS